MKKSKRKLVVAALVFFSISLLATSSAQAKAKKLKVNTVYTTTKKVKGITKVKKAKVVAKIGKKTYKAKSNSKGKFTIKIKKQKKGTKVKVTVYKGKKKYAKKTVKVKTIPWYQKKPFKGHKAAIAGNSGISNKKVFNQYDNSFLVYCKKGYYVKFTIAGEKNCVSTKVYKKTALANVYTKTVVGTKRVTLKIYRNKDDKLIDSYSITPKKVELPSKTAEIDYEQFLKDYDMVKTSGKYISKGVGPYGYFIRDDGFGCIGYTSNYVETAANGAHVKITAKNGATLYYTILPSNGTTKQTYWDVKNPSNTEYDGIIESGSTKKFEGSDFTKDELVGNSLMYKIAIYKNGKMVGWLSASGYLIQGYADWMFK